tara:strand:+ start:350 stop:481 length:132 start_codon:yes stop_codon:yes gene_type:complete
MYQIKNPPMSQWKSKRKQSRLNKVGGILTERKEEDVDKKIIIL